MTAHPPVDETGGVMDAHAQTLAGVRKLVFPELKVEIDAFARLDVDLYAGM